MYQWQYNIKRYHTLWLYEQSHVGQLPIKSLFVKRAKILSSESTLLKP